MNELTAPQRSSIFYIRDVETMKVLVSALRIRILSVLIQGVHTVKEVSQILNVPPNRLYYHFNQMEQFKLIQVVETRMISGILEKHYRSSAVNYLVDPTLLAFHAGRRNDQGLAGPLMDEMEISAEKHLRFSPDGLLLLSQPVNEEMAARKMMLMVPSTKTNEIFEKIEAIIREFILASPAEFTQAESRNTQMLTVVLYPLTQSGRDRDRVEYSQENHQIP